MLEANQTNETAGNTSVSAQPVETNYLKRDQTYTFRKMKLADYKDLCCRVLELENYEEDKIPQDFKAHFEFLEDGDVRRKPVSGSILLPEEIMNLPTEGGVRDVVAQILERELSQFVRYQYIDDFQAIGAHDLETYKKVIAASASRGVSWNYTAEQLQNAVKSIGQFIGRAIGIAEVGEKFANAAKMKFTRSAIQRYLGNFNEDLLKKVKQRLAQWMEYVQENEADNVDDFGTIYMMLDAALDKHLKTDHVNIEDIL